MFDLDKLVRKNIKTLKPYSSARDEFKGEARIFLDANENSLGSPLTKWYNRYPDPLQWKLKEKISEVKRVPVENIFLGNGSDECIDIIMRAFCEPGQDNILVCPPTYGMYEVCAGINNVSVKHVSLLKNFQLDLEGIENAIDDGTKCIFLCSPNNPTGNALEHEDIEAILHNYFGLVIIDEAYINFSRRSSFSAELPNHPNLVVLQTLSKAWGLAALRIGMALASKEIIAVMNRIKPPYNIGQASQELAISALDRIDEVNQMILSIVEQRKILEQELQGIKFVQQVYPSEANFLLVKMERPSDIYRHLLSDGIVVRDRSRVELCEGCLRITVGREKENIELIQSLKKFMQ